MKKWIGGALLLPVYVVIGWVATRWADRFEWSLEQLEFDFDDE